MVFIREHGLLLTRDRVLLTALNWATTDTGTYTCIRTVTIGAVIVLFISHFLVYRAKKADFVIHLFIISPCILLQGVKKHYQRKPGRPPRSGSADVLSYFSCLIHSINHVERQIIFRFLELFVFEIRHPHKTGH